LTIATERHCVARAALAVLALSAALGVAPAAQAQTDPAAAEALFREGRALADAGDIAGACAKFRESARLDPAVGTTFNIADCEERLGHLAKAWTLFGEVVHRLPASDKRHDVAKKRVAALEPRLPKLSVRLAATAPAGTRVTRDGVELGAASLGTPLPVDPGEHVVIVSAPGHADRQFKLIISEREIQTLDVEAGPAQSGAIEKPKTGVELDTTAAPSSSRRSPVLGYVVGGVGVAGFITGAIAGVLVLQKKGVVDEHCPDKVCDDEGYAAVESGKTLGIVTTAGLVTGLVGVGAGTYLIVRAGSREDERAASLTLQGRF
jgi:hypothetical protein